MRKLRFGFYALVFGVLMLAFRWRGWNKQGNFNCGLSVGVPKFQSQKFNLLPITVSSSILWCEFYE